MSPNVLVVEDDGAIRQLLEFTLVGAGFEVRAVASAEQALEVLRNSLYAASLVDWNLPGMSGLAFVRQLRQEERTARMAVILVTARDAEDSKVTGLEWGADDYVSKPFSPRELVARMRALIRRRAPELSDGPLEVGPLKLDASEHIVTLGGSQLDLRLAEYKLLRFLMAHPNRVYSRAQLLDQVWGDNVFVEERTVDVHVRRLRLALGAAHRNLITTVRSGGYKLLAGEGANAPSGEH